VKQLSLILLTIAAAALLAASAHAEGRIVYTKKSLYRNISVVEDAEKLCMGFATRRRQLKNQSCRLKRYPERLALEYTRLTFAGLLLNPRPERIFVAGLGGGSIPSALHRLYPDAHIDVAEIDPAVVDVAERFFEFETSEGLVVHEMDARVYVRHARKKGLRYDYILLDAFNADYIPEHLMTREFLEECRELLSEGGVLVANTFSTSRLYGSEAVTYEAAFGWILSFRGPGDNRIIVTARSPEPPDSELLYLRAESFPVDLHSVGVDIVKTANRLTPKDWSDSARVLTDEYAPANLLRGFD